jgi:hypothetical protein
MRRILGYVLAAVGLLSFSIVAGFAIVIAGGILTPDKIRNLLKYNPNLTATNPPETRETIATTLVRLKTTSYSLPAIDPEFESGGGAIVEVFGGILVAERSGRFGFFELTNGKPKLQPTPIAITINQASYEDYARSQGYDVNRGEMSAMRVSACDCSIFCC